MDEMAVGLNTQAVQHGSAVSRLSGSCLALESAAARLEGAEAVVAATTAAGLLLTLLDLTLRPGDRVVAGRGLAPQVAAALAAHSRLAGPAVAWVEDGELEQAVAQQPGARLVIAATPAAPHLSLPSVERLAAAVHAGSGVLVVDNTLLTGLQHPAINLGADLVLHHSLGVWFGDGRQDGALLAGRQKIVAEVRGLLGMTAARWAGETLGLGLATLPLRLARQSENALEVATFLRHQPQVARVHFPGLPDYPHRDVYRRELQGPGFVLAFQLSQGGAADLQRLLSSLRLCRTAPGPGGVASFAFQPLLPAASDPSRRLAASDTLWLAVGLEDASDVADDLAGAMASL